MSFCRVITLPMYTMHTFIPIELYEIFHLIRYKTRYFFQNEVPLGKQGISEMTKNTGIALNDVSLQLIKALQTTA